jgi:hypothetical protein
MQKQPEEESRKHDEAAQFSHDFDEIRLSDRH